MSEEFKVTLVTPKGEFRIIVGRDQHIWDAAKEAGITLPAICHQGRCLTCAGRLLEPDEPPQNAQNQRVLGAPGVVDQSDSDQYFPEDREAGFVLLCTGKPRSDLRIKTHEQMEMRKFRAARGLPAPYY